MRREGRHQRMREREISGWNKWKITLRKREREKIDGKRDKYWHCQSGVSFPNVKKINQSENDQPITCLICGGTNSFFRTYYISCRKTKNCYKNGYIRDWTSFHNVNIFLKVTFLTCWVVFFFFNISSLISRTIIPLWPFVVCMYVCTHYL